MEFYIIYREIKKTPHIFISMAGIYASIKDKLTKFYKSNTSELKNFQTLKYNPLNYSFERLIKFFLHVPICMPTN